MIYNYLKQAQAWLEGRLRTLCGRITPEKRVAVLLVMFGLFGFMSIYLFASALYRIGHNDGVQIQIEHIKMLNLRKSDSTLLKLNNDGTDQEQSYSTKGD